MKIILAENSNSEVEVLGKLLSSILLALLTECGCGRLF